LKNSFICCTPFHILVSIHLAKTKYSNDDNTIFISDHFASSLKIKKKLEQLSVFNNVYYVKDKKLSYDKSVLNFKKITYFFFDNVSKLINKNPEGFNYDQLFIFTNSFFSKILLNKAIKTNPALQINFVEEGIMTYLLNKQDRNEKLKIYMDKWLQLFFNKRFLNLDIVNKILLFKPAYFMGNINCTLEEIPIINKNDKNFINKLNFVFEYKKQNDFNNYPYIFFDQSFSIDGNGIVNEFEVIKKLINIIKVEEILVKLHPRDSVDKFNKIGNLNVSNANFPWELIYLNEDCNNMTLISVNSSALFSPYNIFGEKHKLILLFDLFNLKRDYLEEFVRISENKEIFIPKTEDELRSFFHSSFSPRSELRHD
jgi:hypothetical protein